MQGTQARKFPHASEQLSLCVTTTEARTSRAYTLQQEKTPQWEAWAPQLEKVLEKQQRPSAAKNK